MSTAATLESPSSNPFGLTQFLLRRFHALAGVEFGAYLVMHLVVNATIAQGGRVFQDQVDKLESIPLLVIVEWTFIFLPILFHAVYGAWMAFTTNYNTRLYPYWGNWRFLLQRVSGIVLIGFLGFHVLSLRFNVFGHTLGFDTRNATYAVWRHTNAHWVIAYGVYPLGILASCFHTANGLWTAAITWGLTTSMASQRRWGWFCAAIFVILLVLGITALVALITMAPPSSLRNG